MWWNDIKEIKIDILVLKKNITRIEAILDSLPHNVKANTSFFNEESLKEAIEDVFCSADEFNSINRIHDKLNVLINDVDRNEAVLLAQKTLDKFEDYMKNVDKLNSMVNEFKGCVSMARGALEDRKELGQQAEETKKLAQISQEIYKAMIDFIKAGKNIKHEAHFKIDAIYKAVCEKPEKKPRKKRSNPKTDSPSP
jgi:acetolactate synthase small subunit